MDNTEALRLSQLIEVNSQNKERSALEAKYGQVWTTDEMANDFDVTGFMAPYVVVKRKSDGKVGSLSFTHSPRFYFHFVEH